MMRAVVVADSHGMSDAALARIAHEIRPHAPQLLIHLGDGAPDGKALAELLGVPLIGVAGNCDLLSQWPGEIVREMGGAKVLLCHGHQYKVKLSPMRLQLRAQEVGAAVALYGHTHIQRADEGTVLLLNPGSLALGKFAVLTIQDGIATYKLHRP